MTAFQLRPYQQESIAALWSALRAGERAPLACLPTGAGKSPVVAELCRQAVQQWKGRVLVLVHVKELVAQLAEAIRRAWPDAFCPLGVISAGLGQRSVDAITVAGIQSAFRRACDIGRVDLIVIDECHLIPPDGDGMYRTLLTELRVINPKLRLVGLTATPYRLGHGLVCGESNVFSRLVYDVPVRQLMEWPAESGGPFLCRLRGKDGGAPDMTNVHHRGGEFVAGELEAAMSDEAKVQAAVVEILRHAGGRMGILVFCCGVKHAALVSAALAVHWVEAPIVTGETPMAERDDLIARFKARELRCLVNVNVLTTGFDAPHVDMVVLLRPTESPGLYYQMVGRGFRLSPHKADCLVLDLAGNIARHGPIENLNDRITTPGDGIAPTKACKQCEEVNPAGAAKCFQCGADFHRACPWCERLNPWTAETCGGCGRPTKKEARHDTVAAAGDPVTAEAPEPEWHEVDSAEFSPHEKRDAPPGHPKTLRVDYWNGMRRVASEWVCVEHDHMSFAGGKALAWLRERLLPEHGAIAAGQAGAPVIDTPDGVVVLTAAAAAKIGMANGLRIPAAVSLLPDGRFTRVVGHRFEATESARETVPSSVGEDDEIPF